MTVRDQLLALQWTQLKHDEAYHKDVVVLPLAQRIKHMALHNAKYTAYLFEVAESGDDARLTRTLTDAFIISLAVANTLNQDLGRELGEAAVAATSLRTFGSAMTMELARSDADPLWLVRAFARHNGQLAKACESWDHLESVPFRDVMRTCNVAILKAVLVEGSARGLDLAEAYKVRIREVETRSIFDDHHREGAGGEA
jgi:hypothetical protein